MGPLTSIYTYHRHTQSWCDQLRSFIDILHNNSLCNYKVGLFHDKWVPFTTAWRVLRLRIEERRPVWRAAANIMNKQSRTTDKGWCYGLGVGRGA